MNIFKTPFQNSLGASVYIALVVSIINLLNYVETNTTSLAESFFFPLVFLSIFSLSVAMMAFFFFYQPIQLFLSNKKPQAATFFLQTAGYFGLITVILALVVLGLSKL